MIATNDNRNVLPTWLRSLFGSAPEPTAAELQAAYAAQRRAYRKAVGLPDYSGHRGYGVVRSGPKDAA